jgi:hypothetical protein
MRITGRLRVAVAMLVAAGCAGNAEPPVAITAVVPASAYSDFPVSLVIEGGPFRPIYDVDTSSGSEMIELGAFTAFITPSGGSGAEPAQDLMWLSTSELAADLPAGIPAGPYDVEVRDPRGAYAHLSRGYLSLGPDTTPPVVTIDEPPSGAVLTAGTEVPVAFEVDDGPGTTDIVTWKVSWENTSISGGCSHAPYLSHVTCRFLFVAPTPAQAGEPLLVLVTATDIAGNLGRAQASFSLADPPAVLSFEPFQGPAAGGTTLMVHGKNFVVGTQVLVGGDLLAPAGGVWLGDTLIQGTTAAHDPGFVTVTVRSGSSSVDARGTFEFVGTPVVLDVTPSSGPTEGCAPVTIVGKNFREAAQTRVSFGTDPSTASPLQCVDYVSPNRIEGLTPPGAGAVNVFAQDPVSGVGELPLAYTYLDVDSPDAGEPPPGGGCPCDGGLPP